MLYDVTVYGSVTAHVGIDYDAFEKAVKARNKKWTISDDGVYLSDDEHFDRVLDFLSGDDWIYLEVSDCVLLQFPGLKDKKAEDIYEGDIIKTPHFTDIDNMTKYLFHRVMFDEKYNAFTAINIHNTDELLTTNGNTFLYILAKKSVFNICGNIYQNGELYLKP
jgi:uncharacterized phage protein (TIGR01671 family)